MSTQNKIDSTLAVEIAGVHFDNPVIAASGTFGFGREYGKMIDLSGLGGIALKALTIKEKQGNPPPRIAETPSGILNSIGLQNPGVDEFLQNEMSFLQKSGTRLICNIAGSSPEEYAAVAEKLSAAPVDMIEVNISCPNVKQGGMAFGVDPQSASAVTKAVRAVCAKPICVKLSPNVTDIVEIARAVESAGADALTVINTLMGMQIDIRTQKPVLANIVGGLSGPAIFPVALRCVWQVAKAVHIPIIGVGGISTWEDAIQMFLAGATAIQVGTMTFQNPYAMLHIRDGIKAYLENQGLHDMRELIGKLQVD